LQYCTQILDTKLAGLGVARCGRAGPVRASVSSGNAAGNIKGGAVAAGVPIWL